MRRARLPAVLLLALAALAAQLFLRARRAAETPFWSEGAFAVLGGLRSIVSEVVWFRADQLQAEGRYVELSLLASTLTAMEPHTPEIWSYASWNLAYNVSVMMSSDEDRWRWVMAGIELLRDKGLPLNPGDPELCGELACLFELKIAATIDASAPRYREFWAALVRDVAAREAWEELRMDREKMREIEAATGFNDWEDAALSAIYWASEGLEKAEGSLRRRLLMIYRQSETIYRKNHATLI